MKTTTTIAAAVINKQSYLICVLVLLSFVLLKQGCRLPHSTKTTTTAFAGTAFDEGNHHHCRCCDRQE